MGQKKSKGLSLVIIILLIIILALIGVGGYLYFFTDIFKSNKQLFFKYTSQIVQDKNGFISDELREYFEKKKNTSYENNGEITFEVNIPNLEDELELANNFNITFSGKEDPSNSKSEKEISINYSNDVNIPITYRKANNITGIQTKYIGSNFVAIKNDEELSGLENINNLIDIENVEFSNEEIKSLKTIYFDNILNTLDDSKFSKLTKENLTGYKLSLTSEELKNILTQILNALKTDTNTLHKLNEILKAINKDIELDEELIEETINNINELELNDGIEITVYSTSGNLKKIEIEASSNNFSINKEQNNQDIIYTLMLNTEKITNAMFTAKYTGLNTENVTENYELTLEGAYEESNILEKAETAQNKMTLESEKEIIKALIAEVKVNKIAKGEEENQISDTDVEEVLSSGEDENYTNMRLEKEDEATFNITFISTGDRFVIDNTGEIIEKPENNTNESTVNTTENSSVYNKYNIINNVQFKQGIAIEDLTDENAVILNDKEEDYVSNLINAIKERIKEVNKVQMEELGVTEDENPILYLIPSFLLVNQQNTEIDEQVVNSFNAKFELYQSTNTKGATVKGLLTVIQNNNESEESNKIEEINFDGEEYEVTEQNITFLKSSINVEDAYRVEFEKDINTGLIYRAVINKR